MSEETHAPKELTPEQRQLVQDVREAARLFGHQDFTLASDDGGINLSPLLTTDDRVDALETFLEAAKLKREGVLPEEAEIDPKFIDDFVEALMHVPRFYQYEPNDERRDCNDIPLWQKECQFAMEPYRFWPSESLTGIQRHENRSADIFWEYAAKLLFKEAERRLHREQTEATVEYLRSKVHHNVVSNIRASYSTTRARLLFFDYDTAAPVEAKRITEELEAVKAAYRELLEKELRKILADKDFMQQLYKSASVYKQVEIEVVLQQDIGLVDRIRSQSETEEDKKLFLSYINQMVKFLPDCEDATAELLSSADAILMGCKGLHKGTREDGDIGKIFVPMTDYGTGHLRSRDEVMQILAHEAAHAQMTKYGKRKLRDHSQRHEMLTYRNLAILRGLEVELVEGPDGELQDFKVVQKDAPTPPPVVPVGPEAPGEAATAPGDSAGVTAPPEPPAKVDAAGEDSPIAIAREALRTAQEARELGQQMHARVERFMESGAWPSSEQTPAQETVSAELKRWHRAIDIYDIGRDPFGNLRIQKDYFLKEIEKLLEATEQGSEDEFSQEFMTSLRALRHFIRTTKETMFGGYTKCDPKEVLQRFERLIELLGPQAQAEAA